MPVRLHQFWVLCCVCAIVSFGSCSSPAADSTYWLKPTSGIRGIFEDSQGNLYFTSPDWTCKYDPSARDAKNSGFTYHNLESESVLLSGFQEDANGVLFAQGTDGIHAYESEQFIPLTNRNYDAKQEWSKQVGDLWFGADGGVKLNDQEGQWGVYRLRDGVCTFLAFPDPPAGERTNFFALTSPAMQAEDGTLWFGTFNAAFGFDGESWDIVGRERMGRAEDSRFVGIRGYHLDSRGNLWMADNGAGLYVYDGEQVIHFTALHNLEDEDTDGNSLHRAFSVAEDDDGNYWFGSVYSGIWRYEPSASDPIGKGTFTNFDHEQGWPCENTWTIYKTRSGELLFAGEDPGGVYRFNGEAFERAF